MMVWIFSYVQILSSHFFFIYACGISDVPQLANSTVWSLVEPLNGRIEIYRVG